MAGSHGAPEAHAAPHGTDDEHGHDDHHHDPAADARVVASIVIALAIGAALAVGLVAPQGRRAQPVAHDEGPHGEHEHSAPEGIVVLLDGEVIVGRIRKESDQLHVHIEDHDGHEGGERVVPLRRVRWMKPGSTTLDEDYWLRHGSERLDERFAREVGGGGIVVLNSGQVLVGRLAVGEKSITIRWPYRDQPQQGEVTVPRSEVRWVDATRDTLGEEYRQQFPDAPVDQRGAPGKGGDQRGQAPPRAPQESHGAADEERSEAKLAKLEGRWAQALRLWSAIYRRTGLKDDLVELRTTATTLRQGATEVTIASAVEALHQELSPVKDAPGIRDQLALAYKDGITIHVVNRQLDQARRWLQELKSLGPEYAKQVELSERAIDQIGKPHDEEHDH